MKTAYVTKYGGPEVIEIRDQQKPVPKKDELLVKVVNSTVTSGSVKLRSLDLPAIFKLPFRLVMGITKPRQPIPGMEFSGEVIEIGTSVTKYKVGDRIYGSSNGKVGTNSDFICISENAPISNIPENISYEQAAAVPIGAQSALFFLRKAEIKKNQRILIYGASGSVGTFAVQLAKHYGAEVIAICSSKNVDLVKSLGADQVLDYTKDEFLFPNRPYDIIFDAVGYLPFQSAIDNITDDGYFISVFLQSIGEMWKGSRISKKTNKTVISEGAPEKVEDLEYLNDLLEEGRLKSVIDRSYPLEDIQDAHRYVDSGRKVGNVVISHGV